MQVKKNTKLKSLSLLGIFVFFSSITGCKSTPSAKEPSSEIPERREFPVNAELNPCENFFEYTCSKANESFKLREDRKRHIYSFSDSSERILEFKKNYLKKLNSSSKSGSPRELLLKNVYQACMNEPSRKNEELSFLQKMKSEILSLKDKKSLADFITSNQLKGHEGFASFGSANNLDNSDVFDFYFTAAKLYALPEKSYYTKKDLAEDYKSLITDFFKIIDVKDPSKTAEIVFNFEKNYSDKYPTPTEQRDLFTKKIFSTKSQILAQTPSLRLAPLFEKVTPDKKIRTPMNKTLSYLESEWKKHDLDTLKNLVLYWYIEPHLDVAFPDYFNKKFSFNHKHLGGSPQRPVLEERCTMEIMASFDKEIDAELFDKFFPNFPTEKFISLLEKVRASIIDGLKSNKWLSDKGRKGAIEKMEKAKFQVVKPMTEKEWDFNLPADYKNNSYISNKLLRTEKSIEKEFIDLKNPVDKTKWWMGPLTVNAWYSPTDNKFVMPAGILQYPFYDPNLPDHVNLGAVGAVVGHELGHGIDDKGAKFDYLGRVNNWMPKTDVNEFIKRGQRLVKQFDDIGHNGKLTLGENIGDLVGVTFALNAAKKVLPKNSEDEALKEFFLQWGRSWCGVVRPKEAERLLKVDSHSAIYARVNEQMKHQEDFHKVFKCSAGNKMYLPPEKQVRIW